MLAIIRTQPTGANISTLLNAVVALRDGYKNIEGYPEICFTIRTYHKIAETKEDNVGEEILLPINLFYETLTLEEQTELYEMYRFAKLHIDAITVDNRREICDRIQYKVFETVRKLKLSYKMIAFCRDPRFIYPNLDDVGKEAHHTSEKTFCHDEYVELTAISLLSKMMVPIWGEFTATLDDIDILGSQREKIAFDLIEPSLEEDGFEKIYMKLSKLLVSMVTDVRKTNDRRQTNVPQTSFIITHNGIDDEMFNAVVMANLIMKRLATYECFMRAKDNKIPNAMVYINNGINNTTNSKIVQMRKSMNTMPRRDLSANDKDDNSSILDHSSKTSRKSIDVPVIVETSVQHWELPRLLVDMETPMDLFYEAEDYYINNPFDISPLTQALVASFVGTRFGGSKCINYLSAHMYRKIVIILQIFLIKQNMTTLASLISSQTSFAPIDGGSSPISSRIQSMMNKSSEYLQCQELIRGFINKPIVILGKRVKSRKQEVDRIDFVNHIAKMADWLIRFSHKENMALALWNFSESQGFSEINHRPVFGSECVFDETLIRDICKFYLIAHSPKLSIVAA